MLRTLLTNMRASRAQALRAARPRFASTNATQEKAQEKAKEVFASAQKGFARAAEAAKKATGGLGERAGALLGGE